MYKLIFFLVLIYSTSQSQTFDLLVSGSNEYKKGYEISVIELDSGDFIVVDCYMDLISFKTNSRLLKISKTGEITDTYEFDIPGHLVEVYGLVKQQNEFYMFGKMHHIAGNWNYPFLGKLDFDFNLFSFTKYDTLCQNCYLESGSLNQVGNLILVGRTQIFDTFIWELALNGAILKSTPVFQFDYIVSIIEMPSIDAYHLINYNNIRQFSASTLQEESPFYKDVSIFEMFYPKRLTDSTYITGGDFLRKSFNTSINEIIDSSNVGYRIFNDKLEIIASQEYVNNKNPDKIGYPAIDYLEKEKIFFGYTKNYYYLNRNGLKSWFGLKSIKEDGSLNWEKFYGGDVNYILVSVTATKDGGALLMGIRYDWNIPQQDLYIIKVDSLGNFTPKAGIGIQTHSFKKDRPKVYPNPATEKVFIETGLGQETNVEILNFQGTILKSAKITQSGHIDISTLAPGIYIYRITGNNYNETGKLIKN
jgi:hypothetical protein